MPGNLFNLKKKWEKINLEQTDNILKLSLYKTSLTHSIIYHLKFPDLFTKSILDGKVLFTSACKLLVDI